jgi:hypothetical protein
MHANITNGIRTALIAVLTIATLIALVFSCNDVEFCCLQYERVTPELTYCNSHSRAAGHFLLDAEEVSEDSLKAAVARLDRLADDAGECQTISCIESLMSGDPGLSGLWRSYQEEHYHVDSVLAADGVQFDDDKKMKLIRCGFTDAVSRTKKNIEDWR